MKKFFALTFCLMLALVIAGCCSTCPARRGCDQKASCPTTENCRQLSGPKNGCEATTARCRRTPASCKAASAQCGAAKCAPACAKCCDKTGCASCCKGGVCSKGKCTAPAAKCSAAKCAPACEKCCDKTDCASCCKGGVCSQGKCSASAAQCAEKKCAPACEKCCDKTGCASCCKGGVCSQGKCTAPAAKCSKSSCAAKPQICPMKPKASMSLNWKLDLSSLQGVQANAAKPEKDIVLGFDFAKRRCYGVSGVNRYFGPITVNPKEGKLSFGQLGSTMMMGPGLKYEQAYLKMLSTVDGCSLDNGQLVLTSRGKVVARYIPIDKID